MKKLVMASQHWRRWLTTYCRRFGRLVGSQVSQRLPHSTNTLMLLISVTVMLADGAEYFLALIWVVMVFRGRSYLWLYSKQVIGYQKLPFPCLMLLDGISLPVNATYVDSTK